MNKYIISLGVALTLLATACSDHFQPFDTNASVEEAEDYRISYFDIDPLLIILESTDDMGYANLKSGFFDLSTHTVEFKHSAGTLRCGIHLQDSKHLEDGEYLLTFSNSEHKPIPGMVRVRIKDERVMEIGEAKSSFSLRHGSGTESDPYIIGSERDFMTFLNDLRVNELTNGRDCYFLQTADVTLMDQSSTKPGRGYFGYSFAGHYDGGGFALKEMYYRGADNQDADSNIGIFPTLLDGAEISNLKITGANISHVCNDVGILAGSVKGHVNLENIDVQGNIQGEKGVNVGGLVGRISNGDIFADEIKMRTSVQALRCVGGLIGYVDSDYRTRIQNVSTPDSHFSVEGHDAIGGLIGAATGNSLGIENAVLSHVVSKEDSDIRTISTTGGTGTGGIIGVITGDEMYFDMQAVSVACPVGGMNRIGDQVGGLIGSLDRVRNSKIGGSVTSIVSGNRYVGGWCGYAYIPDSSEFTIFTNDGNNYVLPDNSAASIEANSCAGGVFGSFRAKALGSGMKCVRVAVNVEASDEMAGGVIGLLEDCTLCVNNFDMSSSTMQVTGGCGIGGIVGKAVRSTLLGDINVEFNHYIGPSAVPDADSFMPAYSGIVKGKIDVGGILGRGEDVSLQQLCCMATVISLGADNLGGIAGSVTNSDSKKTIESCVSKSMINVPDHSNIGGILGYFRCNSYTEITNCINFGELHGGENTSGIIGLYKKYWENESAAGFKPATIKYCVNAGDISGNTCVGGIIANCGMSINNDALMDESHLIVSTCGNFGKISSAANSSEDSGVGGIVGYGKHAMRVEYCSNHGTILSTDSHKAVGGIAGSLGKDATANNFQTYWSNVEVHSCVNFGTVDSQYSSTHVGGILGFMEEGPMSHLKNCANYGEILHKHDSDNGGILGYVDHLGNIYDCVNVGHVENGNATIGTHKGGSIFYHDGLNLIDGSGKTWPSGHVVKKEDIFNDYAYYHINFDDYWDMSTKGPIPKGCRF
ncbi:MAG: hypothetical protein K2K75_13180 [Muribaculaceae bacterium]|nr:hypothetical protein [Muribaculaceae bacterium]